MTKEDEEKYKPYLKTLGEDRLIDLVLQLLFDKRVVSDENDRLTNVHSALEITYKQIQEKLTKAEHDRDRYKTKIAELIAEIDDWIKISNKSQNDLWQIYSQLGVETSGEDGQKQVLKEIMQLKQSQNQKAIDVISKIRNKCWYGGAWLEDNYYKVTEKFLEELKKELKE